MTTSIEQSTKEGAMGEPRFPQTKWHQDIAEVRQRCVTRIKMGDKLPRDIEADKIMILTNFFANHHIQTLGDGEWEVLKTYGRPINSEEEYMLVDPKY